MSAAPGHHNVINALANTSPPSTRNMHPPARMHAAHTLASYVPTATISITLQAYTAPSSKPGHPLDNFSSCKKRESNDSAAVHEGPQRPDQTAKTSFAISRCRVRRRKGERDEEERSGIKASDNGYST